MLGKSGKITKTTASVMACCALIFVMTVASVPQMASAEGRYYEGDPEATHCTLWDTLRLRWPQTTMGREKAKCRRKAVPPTKIAVICRLRTQYIDKDTGSRMCVYKKQGRGAEEEVVSLSPSLNCQRTYRCRYDD